LAIGVGGLVAATLDLLQACILFGHDIILVISYGLVGEKALKGGAGYYALGVLLHVIISLIFATFYYAVSRKLKFMTEYPLVCGLSFGAGVHLVMMLIVLPLSALHNRAPLTIHDMIHDLLVHMVVFGLPVAYGVRWFAKQTPIQTSAPARTTTRNALLAIGVGGLVGATLDLLQACMLLGHDIILVIAYGLVGEKALKGGVGYYSLGILLHVLISLIFATFYYAVSRKLRFMTEYPLVCGLCFGAGVHLVMMLIVLPLCAFHQTDPITIRGMIHGLLIHMVVFGLPVAYGVRRFAR